MNGATEATLQELLLVANRMNINLERFASQVNSTSGGSGGGGLSGLATVAKFATPAGVALGVLQGAASLVGSAFSVLGNILGKVVTGVTKTVENLLSFGVAAAKGNASLSGLYDAFKDLPFFIGDIAHGFSEIVKYSEDLLVTYRQLTRSGASFSGDLYEMRDMSIRAGLSLEEFSKLVSSNGQLFAGMGSGVQAGLQKFVDANGALVGPDSAYAKRLFGLGYTAEDIGNSLAYIMLQQGVGAKKNVMTADQLAAKTADYMTQLDVLAKITGESAAAQEENLKKEQADALFQTFRDSLDPMQKAALDAKIQIAQAFGPDFVLAVKNGARGIITPMTDSMANLNMTTGGILMEMARGAYASVNGMQSEEAARDEFMKQMTRAAQAQGIFSKNMGNVGSALNADLFNQKLQGLYNAMQRGGNDLSGLFGQGLAEQLAQSQGTAAALADANNKIKQFGLTLMQLAGSILGPISKTLIDWGAGLTKNLDQKVLFEKLNSGIKKLVDSFSTYIGPYLDKLGTWFGDTLNKFNAFDTMSWSEIWDTIKKQFGELVNIIRPIWDNDIRPALTKMWDAIKPTVVSMFSELFKAMMDAIRDNSAIARFFIGPGSEKQVEDRRLAEIVASLAQTQQILANPNTGWFEKKWEQKNKEAYMAEIADIKAKQERDSAVSATVAQPKASGGPINPGSYLVGEKGPEVLNVGASGNIVTNDNITELMARAGQSDKVLETLMQMLNSHNVRMLATLNEMSDYTKRNNDALKDLSGDAFA